MPNRLAQASSLYLRQHAGNPVDWYPWGSEALERARGEDRPILLSIGYSACHWCHVMAHESFENEATARLMNESFVCVKVDREERPDLDRIYQTICQLVTHAGGWPLTVALTPKLEPFFAGTYFPPDRRYGRPGFPEVLAELAAAWRTRRGEVEEVAAQWAEAVRQVERPPAGAPAGETAPGREAVLEAAVALARQFDHEHGGFGDAPKFPNPENLELLLRAGGELRPLALQALRSMADGGIHDQLGGGFHRYSVDARWEVPHFEKMLYDNALLLPLYADAHRLTGEARFQAVARGTAGFLARELSSPEGAFYATLDADSEGEEGRFYLWTRDQVEAVAGCEAADHFHLGAEPTTLRGDPGPWRDPLFQARAARARPGRDEKVLAGWNGLAVGGLARAGREHAPLARRAADFVLDRMRLPDGGLLRCWMDGRASIPGTLEDYAYLAFGLTDLYQACLEPRYLEAAIDLCRQAVRRFWDGAFYLTEPSDELIARPHEATDSATPAPAGIMLKNLLRLAPFCAPDEQGSFDDLAAEGFRVYGELMRRHPWGTASHHCALDLAASGATEVVIAAPPDSPRAEEWLERLDGIYLPNRLVACLPPGGPPWEASIWEGRGAKDGRPTLYVCRGQVCSLPAHSWEEVAGLLRE